MSAHLQRRALLTQSAALCAAIAVPAATRAQTKIPLIYSDTVSDQDPRAAHRCPLIRGPRGLLLALRSQGGLSALARRAERRPAARTGRGCWT